MKIIKFEKLDIDRLYNDYSEGKLEKIVAKPDFSYNHAPHVDLSVRPNGETTIKYKIYDAEAAENLRNRHGSNGLHLP